jgi:hypothetical protein
MLLRYKNRDGKNGGMGSLPFVQSWNHYKIFYLMRVHFLWIKPFAGKDFSRRALKSAVAAVFSVLAYFLHRIFPSGRFR